MKNKGEWQWYNFMHIDYECEIFMNTAMPDKEYFEIYYHKDDYETYIEVAEWGKKEEPTHEVIELCDCIEISWKKAKELFYTNVEA